MTTTQPQAGNETTDQYRKKPVVITAVQFTQEVLEAYLFDKAPLPDGLRVVSSSYHPEYRKVWSFRAGIETLEGFMTADIGDWIITGVKGERYPCKPDIFAATYESAARPAPEALAQDAARYRWLKEWNQLRGWQDDAIDRQIAIDATLTGEQA